VEIGSAPLLNGSKAALKVTHQQKAQDDSQKKGFRQWRKVK
jgi:hypothetical protein